jgi:hypothetical protein
LQAATYRCTSDLAQKIKETEFFSASRSESFDVFVKEGAMQSQFRSQLQSQYYCWVGILLACMAILLAGSFGPKGAYYRDPGAVLGKSDYSSQQTELFKHSEQVAQR